MSARKLSNPGPVQSPITAVARQARLSLSHEAVFIHKNGIEFRSDAPFALWTEMTLNLECPKEGRVNCTGVVISCAGNRHTGYLVSMVFTTVSKQSQARLNQLAYS